MNVKTCQLPRFPEESVQDADGGLEKLILLMKSPCHDSSSQT